MKDKIRDIVFSDLMISGTAIDAILKATQPKLCHCRDDSDGAMTVKRINDDFHQCPRCGGLFPLGYIKKEHTRLDESLVELLLFSWKDSDNWHELAKAICDKQDELTRHKPAKPAIKQT